MAENHTFPHIEAEILAYWAKSNTFQRSIDKNRNSAQRYVSYDGPPFANGLPHYGHFVTSCVKDIYPRYHTMKGEFSERGFGWDCHGLPAEMETEKQLGIGGRIAIKQYGIERFNSACKSGVLKYTREWREYITRQARWVDFESEYKTMDIDYMESTIWAFKTLYDKGLMYEASRVMPYSWKCETPLSNFEIHLDNSYRQKKSKSVYVKFELEDVPDYLMAISPQANKFFLVAWTTTPWTLPSNLGLAVGNNIDYSIIEHESDAYIVATELKDSIMKLLKHRPKETE